MPHRNFNGRDDLTTPLQYHQTTRLQFTCDIAYIARNTQLHATLATIQTYTVIY